MRSSETNPWISCLLLGSNGEWGRCSSSRQVLEGGRFPFVTVSEKTRHMGFFMKVEFYVWLISSSIELTRIQVSDRLRASLWRNSALLVIAPHPP